MSEPIETAPKDGKPLLVWEASIHRWVIAFFHLSSRQWRRFPAGTWPIQTARWAPLPPPEPRG